MPSDDTATLDELREIPADGLAMLALVMQHNARDAAHLGNAIAEGQQKRIDQLESEVQALRGAAERWWALKDLLTDPPGES